MKTMALALVGALIALSGCKSIDRKASAAKSQSIDYMEKAKLWVHAIAILDELEELKEEQKIDDVEAMKKLPKKVQEKSSERLTYVENLRKYTPTEIQEIIGRGMIVTKKKEPFVISDENEPGSYERLLDPATGEIAFRVRMKIDRDRHDPEANFKINSAPTWFIQQRPNGTKIDWRDPSEDGDIDGYDPRYLDVNVEGMRQLSIATGLDEFVTFPQSGWVPVKVEGRETPVHYYVWIRNEEAVKNLGDFGSDFMKDLAAWIVDSRVPQELRDKLKEFEADILARFDRQSMSEDRNYGMIIKGGKHVAMINLLDRIAGNTDRHPDNYRVFPDGLLQGHDEDWALLDEKPQGISVHRMNLKNLEEPLKNEVRARIASLDYKTIADATKASSISYTSALWSMTRLKMLKDNPDWIFYNDYKNSKDNVELYYYQDLGQAKNFVSLLGLDPERVFFTGGKARSMFRSIFKKSSMNAKAMQRGRSDDKSLGNLKVTVNRDDLKMSIKVDRFAEDLVDDDKTEIREQEVKNFKVEFIEDRGSHMVTLASKTGVIYAAKDGSSLRYCSIGSGCGWIYLKVE
jgi:hypothetical protein